MGEFPNNGEPMDDMVVAGDTEPRDDINSDKGGGEPAELELQHSGESGGGGKSGLPALD